MLGFVNSNYKVQQKIYRMEHEILPQKKILRLDNETKEETASLADFEAN